MISDSRQLQIGLPKGRMQNEVLKLLADAGLPVQFDSRDYRPIIGAQPGQDWSPNLSWLPRMEAKFLKAQNIVEMLDLGSRDIGFAGADWMFELDCHAIELLDTGLDPVRIVVAAPEGVTKESLARRAKKLVVASEYERLAQKWINENVPEATLVRSYGATEAFPPEDADIIIDNCASGSTLRSNNLEIIDVIMTSSTRFYISQHAYRDPERKQAAEFVTMLLKAVLEARHKVIIEVNVEADKLDGLIQALPFMRAPTISPLRGGKAFAVRVAAPRSELAALIPEIKKRGGNDIVVMAISHLVP